jgi:bifunctional DNA-binding transcriptional regulator/antitoxin component of YhaV-PrlF toxin-antitoxin module
LNRAEIARFLRKRYQHVRNVLEADKLKVQEDLNLSSYQVGTEQRTGESCAPTAFFRLTAGRDGSLVLPRHVLEAFGAAPGEVLIGMAQPGEIVLRTAAASIGRAQELVRALIPGDDSLADSLVADRRREDEQERANG